MRIGRTRFVATPFLVVVWLLFWGHLSVGNVLSGIVVAVLVTLAFPYRTRVRSRVHLHPWGFIKLSLYFFQMMAQSTWSVIREVATIGDGTYTAILAVPLRGCSDFSLTSVANVVSLTPGTSVIDMTTVPTVIYVYVLHAENEAKVRADIARLNHLTVRAFGSADDIAALSVPAPWERFDSDHPAARDQGDHS